MSPSQVVKLRERLLGSAVLVLLLLSIEVIVRMGLVNAAIVPRPTTILERLLGLIAKGAFVAPLLETLYLLFVGYAIGCTAAVCVGVLMGRYRRLSDTLEPLIELMRPLPKPALLPPLILFLGLGDAMKLSIIGLGVFFPVLINTVQGVRGVDPVLLDVARTFGRGAGAQLRLIVLPAALPMVLAGMRVSLGLGLVLVVIAEMLAGTGGIGFLIIDMQRSFRVADMYAWIVILAVLGFTLNHLFVRIERRTIHWSFTQTP
jgi:ABC-type nitrate/sulfonate/bicarbonate transport system permease component